MSNRLLSGLVLALLVSTGYIWAYRDPFVPIEPPKPAEHPGQPKENIVMEPAKNKPVTNPLIDVNPVSSKQFRKEEQELVKPVLDISGLFWGSRYNLAIIGDKIFYEGDKYNDVCTIASITNGKLILKCQDKVWIYETKERNK